MKIFAAIVIVIFIASIAFAQPLTHSVERLTIDDGLSQNYIFSALQDHIGYLWFGTKDGLNKFDGYRFTIYRNERSNPNSLSDNNVTALFEDSDNSLWIGTTTGGLDRFDRLKDDFERFSGHTNYPLHLKQNPISLIRESPKNIIWIGTSGGGLFRYDKTADRFEEYTADSSNNGSIPNNFINGFAGDSLGNVWIGTGTGLAHFDQHNGSFVRYQRPGPDARGSFNMISSLNYRSANSLWVGHRLGFDRFDVTKGTFERLLFATDSTPFFWPSKADIDERKQLWIAFSNDLMNFDPEHGTTKSVIRISPERFTKSLVIDRSGIVWVGSTGWGIYKYNPFVMKFGRHDGNFLTDAFSDGIAHVQKYLKYKITERTFNFSLRGGNIQAMFRDRSNTVWIAGLDEPVVYRVDGTNHSVRSLSTISFNQPVRYGLSITGIYQGRDGAIWLSTVGGISTFNETKNRFEYHRIFPGGDFSPGPLNRYGYPDITCFYQDRKGIIWLGTPNYGLARYDPVMRTVKFYSHDVRDSSSISSDHILTIHEDPKNPSGMLWIGTDGGGLNRFEIASEQFTVFTDLHGLPNNVVYGILEDDDGFLWMSTNKGLTKFDPQKISFRNFEMNDGLQSNEFNRLEYLKAPDGRFFFGGINGYNVFRPSDIVENHSVPRVVLTDLKIRNQSVSFRDPSSPLKVPISETKEIVLDYSQNMITFEFAALEYSSAKSNQFAYKLDGFNQEWIYSGISRTATYTNLDPGKYTFHVKASNNDGMWNEQGTSLAVTVLPPFWMAWWFRLIAIIIFLSVGPMIYFRRVSGLKKEQKRQHEFSRKLIESQEMERRRIAAEMHDGIGQDVLLIRNHAMLALQHVNDSDGMSRHMKEISDSAAEMVGSVRQIAHNLRPIHLERFGLSETLTLAVEQTASASSMIWTWEIANIDGSIAKPEEINIYRIVQEGINNILKHAEAAEARIEVKRENSYIVIMMSDNGKGFDVELARHKAGLGISGIEERVHLLGGTLKLTSVPGKTTFIVTIPTTDTSHDE